jgi:hypothetical protein
LALIVDNRSMSSNSIPAHPQWTVDVRELSAGAYTCVVTDEAGRSVGATGDDPETLVGRCVSDLEKLA